MSAELMTVENASVSTTETMFGDSLLKRFLEFADVPQASRVTYTKSLRQLLNYFAANKVTAPTRQDLQVWIKGMEADVAAKKKSPSTVKLYVTVARIFFRWLAQENLYPNVADKLKAKVTLSRGHKKDALDTEQCRQLVNNVTGTSVKDLRDRAILSLMTTAGLRCVEVVRANIENIRFDRGKVFLDVVGKGRDETSDDDTVLLSKQTYKAIREYLKARGKVQSSDPLFASTSRRNFGKRLDTQTVSKLVKRNLRGIGLDSPRLTAHSLRHAVASILVDKGVATEKVQKVLRHRSITTTMIYVNAWKRFNNDSEQFLSDLIFGKFKE